MTQAICRQQKKKSELNDLKSFTNASAKSTNNSAYTTSSKKGDMQKSNSRSPVFNTSANQQQNIGLQKKNIIIYQEDQGFTPSGDDSGQIQGKSLNKLSSVDSDTKENVFVNQGPKSGSNGKKESTRYDQAKTDIELTEQFSEDKSILEQQAQINKTAEEAVRKAETGITLPDDPREVSNLKIEKERLEKTIDVLEQQLSDKKDGDALGELLLKTRREAEKDRDQLKHDNFRLENLVQELTQQKEQLQREAVQFVEQLKYTNKANEEVTSESNSVNKLNIELQSENARLRRLEEENKNEINSLRITIEQLNKQNNNLISENIDLKARISELEKQLNLTKEENSQFKDNISVQKLDFNSLKERTDKEISDLKIERTSLKNTIQAQSNQIDELQKLNQTKVKEIDFLFEQKEQVKRDNEDIRQKLIVNEEENYGFKKTQLDILVQLKLLQVSLKSEQERGNTLSNKLKQSQEQCQNLSMSLRHAQSKIADLQSQCEQLAKNQAIYIGKAGDPIDMAMAKFLNRYPERKDMKILFLRESEGVYRFG